MNRLSKAGCLLAGLAIAVSAPAALAAKPDQTPQQRKAAIEKIKKNHRTFKQPRTMAESNATQVRKADGSTHLFAPTELWNHLAVQKDAQGNLHMIEGSDDTAPTGTLEGLDNE